jgi:hypothetical protein
MLKVAHNRGGPSYFHQNKKDAKITGLSAPERYWKLQDWRLLIGDCLQMKQLEITNLRSPIEGKERAGSFHRERLFPALQPKEGG